MLTFMDRKMNSVFKEKEDLLSKSELSIWLDRYEDIYSDFDSRPFTDRALSDDFIAEAKKRSKEKPTGTIELKLMMPEKGRKQTEEELIVKSLHAYFRRLSNQLKAEMNELKRKGLLLTLLGITIMICAVYVSLLNDKSFLINTARVILEPAGWFFTWTGLDHIFYISGKKSAEYNFVSRMAHAKITFLSF